MQLKMREQRYEMQRLRAIYCQAALGSAGAGGGGPGGAAVGILNLSVGLEMTGATTTGAAMTGRASPAPNAVGSALDGPSGRGALNSANRLQSFFDVFMCPWIPQFEQTRVCANVSRAQPTKGEQRTVSVLLARFPPTPIAPMGIPSFAFFRWRRRS